PWSGGGRGVVAVIALRHARAPLAHHRGERRVPVAVSVGVLVQDRPSRQRVVELVDETVAVIVESAADLGGVGVDGLAGVVAVDVGTKSISVGILDEGCGGGLV